MPEQGDVDKIYTLSQSIVAKTFGQVKKDVPGKIRQEFQSLVSEKKLNSEIYQNCR